MTERWAVLVSEILDGSELAIRLAAAAYLDEKFGCLENPLESGPKLLDLNSLD